MRTIREIAKEIDSSWSKVNYAARPYLDAMYEMDTVERRYGSDSGKSIVVYFLSNAQGWRGEDAKRIKKELNSLI